MKAILFLAVVTCVVEAADPPVLLFQESFEDTNFTARGWYDVRAGVELSPVQPLDGSTHSYQARFQTGQTTPATPGRHAFPETDSVYISFWVRFSSNWIGSGRPYHPHFMHLLTNKNSTYTGPSWTHLTTYLEFLRGTPRMAIQDGQNITDDSTGHNRAVAGCNGSWDAYPPGDCYTCASGRCNGKTWDAKQAYFTDSPGPYYKGDWHRVEASFQLNTISSEGRANQDGILQYFVDGAAVIDIRDVVLRTAKYPDMKFNQFLLAPYIGDGSPADQSIWVDNLVVATGKLDAAPPKPVVSNGGVVNAASFAPGQPVAPGSLVAVFGTGLAATEATAASIPLPASLGGAALSFNGAPAPLLSVFPGLSGGGLSQVNAQIPWDVLPPATTSGTVSVVSTVGDVSSVPEPVRIGEFAPGIFTFQSGAGQAAATTGDGSALVAPEGFLTGAASRPARIGEVITFYATGLGPVDFPPASGDIPGRLASTLTTPAVLIGGVPAEVTFSGLAPCCVGLNQVNVRVPGQAPAGDAVPLQVQLGGITTSDKVTIAVTRQ